MRHAPILLLAPAVFIAILVLHRSFRPPIFQGACEITGCSPAAMTAITWLLTSLPLWWVITGILLRRFLRPWQLLCGLALAAGWTLALIFPPDTLVDERKQGPWAGMTTSGAGLGGLSIALVVLTQAVLGWLVISKKLRLSLSQGALVAALISLVPLPIALLRADRTAVEARILLPEKIFIIDGHTLRRTSATDQRGCAGLLPDDRPLGNCVRTARLTFASDDSDTVVRLAAVLYSSKEAAEAARNRLPADAEQTGISGDTITVRSVQGYWLVLCTVGHADGRPILAEERDYLLRPARQVADHFARRHSGNVIAAALDRDIDPGPSSVGSFTSATTPTSG